jgi:hypothetical protein
MRDANGAVSRRSTAIAIVALFAAAPFLRCPIAAVARVPCPGCGLTRATLALLHGDVAASLHHHPLASIVVPLVVAVAARAIVDRPRGARWDRLERVAIGVVGVASLVVWIARFLGAFGGPEPV